MTEREILVHCPYRYIPDGRRNGPRLSIKSNILFCEIRRSIGIYHAILGLEDVLSMYSAPRMYGRERSFTAFSEYKPDGKLYGKMLFPGWCTDNYVVS